MALIKCPECNNEVSDKAAACPKCGAPVAASGPAIAPAEGSVKMDDGTLCPFCQRPLAPSAISCQCGAEYGYYNESKNKMYNDSEFEALARHSTRFLLMTGSTLAVLMVVILLLGRAHFGVTAILVLAALFVAPFVFISFFAALNVSSMKSSGKRWWKRRLG